MIEGCPYQESNSAREVSWDSIARPPRSLLPEGSWPARFCGTESGEQKSLLRDMSRYSVRRGNPGDEARVGDADADEGASSSGWKAEIESR